MQPSTSNMTSNHEDPSSSTLNTKYESCNVYVRKYNMCGSTILITFLATRKYGSPKTDRNKSVAARHSIYVSADCRRIFLPRNKHSQSIKTITSKKRQQQ